VRWLGIGRAQNEEGIRLFFSSIIFFTCPVCLSGWSWNEFLEIQNKREWVPSWVKRRMEWSSHCFCTAMNQMNGGFSSQSMFETPGWGKKEKGGQANFFYLFRVLLYRNYWINNPGYYLHFSKNEWVTNKGGFVSKVGYYTVSDFQIQNLNFLFGKWII